MNSMALDSAAAAGTWDAPVRDLYEVGEMPPLGHVPAPDVRLGDPPRAAWRA